MKPFVSFGLACIMAVVFSVSAPVCPFAAPGLINYQARLTDSSGSALDGSRDMTFSLYDALSGGTLLWQEIRTVDLDQGVLNVNLGEITPFGGTEFTGTRPVFVQIDVYNPASSSWEKMSPRQQLTSVPFALNAQSASSAGDATTLDGHDASAFAPFSHDHDKDYVNEGQAGAVSTAMIADGAVTARQVRDNSLSAAKIIPDLVSSLDGVASDGGNIDLVGGSNITITPDDGANTITISAAGSGTADHGALTGLLDDDHPQYLTQGEGDIRFLNNTGDTMAGGLTVMDNFYANNGAYIGTDSGTDNDFLFMDGAGTTHYFSWQDSEDTFYANNDLSLLGVVQTGGTIANPGYNRLGTGTASFSEIAGAADLLVSDDLEVGDDTKVGGALTAMGTLKTEGDLYLGTLAENDNDYLFMDGANESLFWNEAETRFQFTDDLYLTGSLETDGDVNAAGDVTTTGEFSYSYAKIFFQQIPAIAFFPVSSAIYVRSGTAMTNANGYFYAPVQLPQGAKVTKIRFFYYDNDPDNSFHNVATYFYRRQITDAEPVIDDEMDRLSWEFSGSSVNSGLVQSVNHTEWYPSFITEIDNENYQYVLKVGCLFLGGSPSDDTRFYGARIEYRLQTMNH